MALPWFRVDSHIGSHDKILTLLSMAGATKADRWQAAFSYVCAIGWAVDHGTDGAVPRIALSFVHGTTTTARLLVIARLWEETATGWQIRNFAERQEMAVITEQKAEFYRARAEKGNCRRWHGDSCWTKDKGCSRD